MRGVCHLRNDGAPSSQRFQIRTAPMVEDCSGKIPPHAILGKKQGQASAKLGRLACPWVSFWGLCFRHSDKRQRCQPQSFVPVMVFLPAAVVSPTTHHAINAAEPVPIPARAGGIVVIPAYCLGFLRRSQKRFHCRSPQRNAKRYSSMHCESLKVGSAAIRPASGE